ncbi:AraC/XylS family transcriptional regulator [Klebsiella variicola]|nr:AraC/XylS family transcriptional regulator [Klebsiella variicola]
MLATPQQLIVLPADVELEVINQPENGLFCSDLLSLTPELLTTFKTRYLSEPPPGRLTSLCAPVTTELAFMWQSVLQAVREGLSTSLQLHQTMGLLLALHEAGYAGPLLVERSRICRRRFDNWSCCRRRRHGACRGWRKCSFSASPPLRRRLQQESQSFRQIVEEVRMAHALGSCRPPRGQ